MTGRYVCIHGHFYQPPRENPWLEAIELQDSAHPYHDWNERITAECYATNATSRILDGEGWIVEIVNNYANMSFNFGPTLLSWMEGHARDVYGAILEADQESQRRFSGHGSALAQAYNHMILPLANRRDKNNQIIWGIRDFERRFGRSPEGMWLPETAVDLESLDILAEMGIRFTILAPHQANRVRLLEDEEWEDVSGGSIDPTMAYTVHLPSGRTISLFFYDGPISRAVAFERLLSKGESFAQRLLVGFSENRSRPQLVHIATDGETYGHHHPFGDMAMAYALHYIESNNLARLTNYSEFLEKNPPTHEVEIIENTSWSCGHGIERWRNDCGCHSGRHPGWNQAWRAPLRQALDWLRDALTPSYEREMAAFFKDPWGARDEYIRIILNRSRESIDQFLAEHAVRVLDQAERIKVLKLLELQRYAMLMYTSCGWFFDDLSGIETVQVIQYAGRALQLAEEIFGDATEQHFRELLQEAKSNIAEYNNGNIIYEKFVEPAALTLEKVGAHYAVSSLFEDYAEDAGLFCYTVRQQDFQTAEAGRAKLAVGRAKITSEITQESVNLSFGVLHWGDHNLRCGVGEQQGEKKHQSFVKDVFDVFARADFPETLRILDKRYGTPTYSLTSLFRDDQRRILDSILAFTLQEVETIYRQLYENNTPLMRFLTYSRIPPPKALYLVAEFIINATLRRIFEEDEELDTDLVYQLLEEAKVEGVNLDTATLEYAFRKRIEQMAVQLMESPDDLSLLKSLDAAVGLAGYLPFQVNLWKVQNICYELMHSVLPQLQTNATHGDNRSGQLTEYYVALSERLLIRML